MEKTQNTYFDKMAKNDFMSSTAHDIRNPLHTLLIYTECMLGDLYGELTDDQRDAVQQLRNASTLLTGLVNNVFSLDMWERREIPICRSDFDLIGTVVSAVSILNEKAKSRKVKLTVESALRVIPVRLDRDKLGQAVLNLLVPLVRMTEGDEIIVTLEEEEGLAVITLQEKTLILTDGELATINAPFSGGDGGQFGGRILGIAMAKAFIEAQGGSFYIMSESGITFRMKLPL